MQFNKRTKHSDAIMMFSTILRMFISVLQRGSQPAEMTWHAHYIYAMLIWLYTVVREEKRLNAALRRKLRGNAPVINFHVLTNVPYDAVYSLSL